MNLKDIKKFPPSPGVYLMKNVRGTVIYVGKAKNLKKRVSSYFGRKQVAPKTGALVAKVNSLEYIVTLSELDALILECNLIKKYRPRYNVVLKDDKSFPFIKIDLADEFPGLRIVRNPNFKIRKKTEIFYGPFPSGSNFKKTVRFLNRLFKICTCSVKKMKNRTRPCINYDMGLCRAPCCGKIGREEYRKQVEQLILFLKGRNRELIRVVRERMKEASSRMDFERAATLRDRISELKELTAKKLASGHADIDMDALGMFQSDGYFFIYLLFIRCGMILGGDSLSLNIERDSHPGSLNTRSILETFLNQYYSHRYIPEKIILSELPENRILLERSFSALPGRRVKIFVPRRGKNLELLRLATENAKNCLEDRIEKKGFISKALLEIKRRLQLQTLPHLIECFDISNFGGRLPVASKVVFREGEADKSGYRHYKIKGNFQEEQNDFAMMSEVISRAYSKTEEEPDLILVDGGKGQLNVVCAVLKEMKKKYPCAAIAKGRLEGDFRAEELLRSRDRIFILGRKNPVSFRPESPGLLLLGRIRDEAHRFAITFNRKLVRKNLIPLGSGSG